LSEEPNTNKKNPPAIALRGKGIGWSYTYEPRVHNGKTWLHALLFLLTAYTTTLAGMMMSSDFAAQAQLDDWTVFFDPRYLVHGLSFSVSLLAILGIHEMGHYVAARAWHVRASLPYFIPFPSMIGTLGAVIKLHARIPNRRALVDIGAAGPLAGFVVAVVALVVGLDLSEVVVTQQVPEGAMSLGDSLLSGWIGSLVVGDLPEGYDVMLHPVAFAGWLGLFVTVLNLLPMGQFDGGHIVYAVFGRWHTQITRATLVSLGLIWALTPPYAWWESPDMVSDWFYSRFAGWLVWMFLGLFLGRDHPPPENPYIELDPPRRWIAYLCLAILVLCFLPNPIRFH
jgi:membrane-associated protease RseP (regulator of RpoE activity)